MIKINYDKAHVALALNAAPIQSPILMHLEYCVHLPDHDFVIEKRRKLILCMVCATFKQQGKSFIQDKYSLESGAESMILHQHTRIHMMSENCSI